MEPQNTQVTFDSSHVSAFRSIAVRNYTIVAVVIALLVYAVWKDSSNVASAMLTSIILAFVVIIVAKFLFFKKIAKVFSVGTQGIVVDGKVHQWNSFKDFHLLGDSQDERAGLVSVPRVGIDLANEYIGTSVFVMRPHHGIFGKTLNLQVSPERRQEFIQILATHSISRESRIKMLAFGMNKWFVILFLVPFLLLALILLFFSMQNS